MTRQLRDSQRSKVYRAECIALADRSERLETVPEMQQYVDKILRSRWFKGKWDYLAIQVKDGRGRSRACGGYYGFGTGYIKMPKWSRTRYVVLHEMAHVITGMEHRSEGTIHGRRFMRVYLALVGRWMGKAAAADLRSRCKEHRVKWRTNGKA